MVVSKTFFTDATTFLMDVLETVKGETITYTRSSTSKTVDCVRGKSTFNIQLSDGTIQQHDTIDFFIRVADLTTLGDPQKNDTIVDAAARKYQVLPAAGIPYFSIMDSERLVYRVHTKEIKA